MTPRELIAAGRRAGFEHRQLGAWEEIQHTWTNRDWYVELRLYPEEVAVDIYRRRPGPHMPKHVATVVTDSADDLAEWLDRLGVLPSPTGAAA